MFPEDLRYTKDHEWIRVLGDRGIVGITDYAQNQLGDVVFVELPEAGLAVSAGQSFGTVESVKAVSELFSPVTGDIVEVNKSLVSAPEVVNSDPYGKGWMLVVKLKTPAELSGLMDASAYAVFVQNEGK
jgi:glycine cleavage system H protein